jgi:hypothetical protein
VTITGFQDYVHNLCAELVFNLHEIVINEWWNRPRDELSFHRQWASKRFFTRFTWISNRYPS